LSSTSVRDKVRAPKFLSGRKLSRCSKTAERRKKGGNGKVIGSGEVDTLRAGDGELPGHFRWAGVGNGESRSSPRAACLRARVHEDTQTEKHLRDLWCPRATEEKNRVYLIGRRRPVRLPYSEPRVVGCSAVSRHSDDFARDWERENLIPFSHPQFITLSQENGVLSFSFVN
jgi:hypothetical protein